MDQAHININIQAPVSINQTDTHLTSAIVRVYRDHIKQNFLSIHKLTTVCRQNKQNMKKKSLRRQGKPQKINNTAATANYTTSVYINAVSSVQTASKKQGIETREDGGYKGARCGMKV